MVAVLGNNSEILRLLVEAHADINAQDAVCDLRDNVTTENKFSCHDFFMQNPSLSGRGRAIRKNPPELLIEG